MNLETTPQVTQTNSTPTAWLRKPISLSWRRPSFFFLLAAVLLSWLKFAQQAHAAERDWAVETAATVSSAPPQITVAWRAVPNVYTEWSYTNVGYRVWRKLPAETNWGDPVAIMDISVNSFADTNVSAGATYEYRVGRDFQILGNTNATFRNYGYVTAGLQLPAVHDRGTALVLVDAALAPLASTELERFVQDLRGDGWRVIRRNVSRSASVTSVRGLIQGDYAANPDLKSLVLLGAVPQPYSGEGAWDGHVGEHEGAWPTDAYYADVDGVWTDTTVNVGSGSTEDPRNYNFPGDGKFDQSYIPSPLELEVGRVDLRNMPAFALAGESTLTTEARLLRRYLDKDHQWRHREFTVPTRAVVTDGFNAASLIEVAWRTFSPLVNWANVSAGRQGYWFPDMANNAYLLGCGSGFGQPNFADLITSTPAYASNTNKVVFVNHFGSYFGDWGYTDCFLRAPIAGKGYGLTCVWLHDSFSIHGFGLGQTMGDAIKQSANVNSESNTYEYTPVVNCLMGDPTVRMNVVAPPTSLTVTSGGTSQQLQWSASAQAADGNFLGYHVYRASDPNGPWTRLTTSPVALTQYADATMPVNAYYMVRAALRTITASGTYDNLSQGAFADAVGLLQIHSVTANPVQLIMPSVTSTVRVDVVSLSNAPLTFAWSKLSGPGTVGFAPPNSSNSVATFSGAGEYELQVVVADNLGNSSTGAVAVSVLPSYAVSYDANSATSGTVPAAQLKVQDVPLTLATNVGGLARTGYTFAGWNTAADGSGTSYASGGTYSTNSEVTLYARWKIIYVYDGGPSHNDGNMETAANYDPDGAPTGGSPNQWNNQTDILFSEAGWNYVANDGANFKTAIAPAGGTGSKTVRSLTVDATVDTPIIVQVSNLEGTSNSKDLLVDADSGNATITHSGSASLTIGKSGTFTATGCDIDLRDTVDVTVGGSGSVNLNVRIIDTTNPGRGINKLGDGTLVLTDANTYTGSTRVYGGVLFINGAQTSATGAVIVGGPGASGTPTLRGNGTVGGNVTVKSADGGAGTLAPGLTGSVGTLTLNNKTLTLDPGSKLVFRLGATDDQVAGVGTLALNGQQWSDFTFTTTAGFGPGIHVLINAASVTGTLGGTVMGSIGVYNGMLAVDANNDLVLYVSVGPNSTVTYDGNGATGGLAPASQIKVYDIPLTLAGNTGNLQKTGLFFVGWNTAADGSGTDYAVGGSYTNNTSVTLYAKWTAQVPTYTVTYHANGATSGSVPSPQTKTNGVPLTLAGNTGNLQKTGYYFTGWNTATNGTGTSYAPGGSYTDDANVTLYVKWTAAGSGNTWTYGAGTGDWTTTGNWNPAPTWASSNGDEDLVFDGAYTIPNMWIGASKAIRSLTVNGNVTANVSIRCTTTETGTTGSDLFMDVASGSCSVTHNGSGNLTIGVAGSLGIFQRDSTTYTVNGSGALIVDKGIRVNASSVNVAKAGSGLMKITDIRDNGTGGGAVTVSGGTLELTGNGLTKASSITVGSGAVIKVNSTASKTQSTAGGIFNNNVITGAGGLEQASAFTLTLDLTNSYTGPTTVKGGTLLINGGTSSGAVTVGGAGATGTPTLGGTGTIGGNVTIASAGGGVAGALSPGGVSTAGTLTLNNSTLTLQFGAKLNYRLGTTSDKVAGVSTLNLNGQVWSDFTFATNAGFGPGTYVLVAATSVTGSLGATASGSVGSYTGTLSVNGNNDLVLTVSGSGSTPGSLTNVVAAGGNVSFTASGSGLLIVQVSTNLVDWVSLLTNTAPFSFTDTNAVNTYRLRFYRTRTP